MSVRTRVSERRNEFLWSNVQRRAMLENFTVDRVEYDFSCCASHWSRGDIHSLYYCFAQPFGFTHSDPTEARSLSVKSTSCSMAWSENCLSRNSFDPYGRLLLYWMHRFWILQKASKGWRLIHIYYSSEAIKPSSVGLGGDYVVQWIILDIKLILTILAIFHTCSHHIGLISFLISETTLRGQISEWNSKWILFTIWLAKELTTSRFADSNLCEVDSRVTVKLLTVMLQMF